MEVTTQRLDHLGIIAGVIKDIGLVELIDNRIPKHAKQDISTGEAVAGMIINGLGFSDRPMTLTPQFFQSKAMETLFRTGVTPDMFNRFKLGRALDACHEYGCDTLFSELSLQACQINNIDCRFNSEDTTSFTLTGEYNVDSDEHTIEINHGYSKDHRPDLKQAMLELMVSQDGGVPIVSRSWNGNSSDSKIFRERSRALIDTFKNSPTPRYLVADSKLYSKETIEEALQYIPFITRVPSSVKLERETIRTSLETPLEKWKILDERNRCVSSQVEYAGLRQRWITVGSKDMEYRSTKTIDKVKTSEKEALSKELSKYSKKRFSCREDAEKGLLSLQKMAKLHSVKIAQIIDHKVYEKKGRPGHDTKFSTEYQVIGTLVENQDAIEERVKQGSCYIIGTTVPEKELSDQQVVEAYKGQNSSVERGFRFLKDPLFFTSSLFIKKPERIMGLLMVMTLALLVYSIAQRNLRLHLQKTEETLPNQIKKEVATPTLRWIFQLMEGIELVQIRTNDAINVAISGLTTLRMRILSCFPLSVQKIYGLTT
jgi:transposase